MSAIDVLRSFAESREHDAIVVRGGITYGDCREVLHELRTFMAERDERMALRVECDALRALLERCLPVVESEAALMDSMARHMAGGFPVEDVASADKSADFHWVLLRDIDAALGKEKP